MLKILWLIIAVLAGVLLREWMFGRRGKL